MISLTFYVRRATLKSRQCRCRRGVWIFRTLPWVRVSAVVIQPNISIMISRFIGQNAVWVPGLYCAQIHLLIAELYKCLLAYFTSPLTFLLTNSLSYLSTFLLSTFLRIGPLRFQTGCRKRLLNLALVFCVNFVLPYVLLYMHFFIWLYTVLDLVFICNGIVCIFVFLC